MHFFVYKRWKIHFFTNAFVCCALGGREEAKQSRQILKAFDAMGGEHDGAKKGDFFEESQCVNVA